MTQRKEIAMREIKFRGKQLAYHQPWIYGYLLEDKKEGRAYILDKEDQIEIHPIRDPESDETIIRTAVEVDPKTIGQYTGLTDKNGVEIYEGDILSKGQAIREVYFEEDRFYNGAYSLALSVEAGFAVIGNIYDNPELLKGG